MTSRHRVLLAIMLALLAIQPLASTFGGKWFIWITVLIAGTLFVIDD